MDEVIQRFPLIADKLFKEIDNEESAKCKEVSKLWCNFINNQKDFWLRIIRLRYEGPSQLWKLDGRILKNKANFWTSNDEWYFFNVRKMTFITTKNKVLIAKNDGKVIQEDYEDCSFEQLWKTGKPDTEGYFTLENSKVPKVLTAISECSLEIKDPYGHLNAFPDLWKKVICKTSTEKVRDIALAVQNFFGPSENHGKEQYPPHHVVAAVGSKELYEYVAKKTKMFNSRSLMNKATALHYSAMFGNLEISKLIIGNEDNKNPEDIWGITPLHAAATHGKLEVCKLIIGNVIDKNPKNEKGDTPLHFAAQCSNFDICRFIIDNVSEKNPHGEKGDTPLHWLALIGNTKLCKYIVENVTDKNPINDSGVTPLHEAAAKNHLEICKLIVPKLEEKCPRDNLQNTPLHYAAKAGNFGIIYYMIDFVEDGQPLDMDGKTPQNYMEQIYESLKVLENLNEKINYYARRDDSEGPNPATISTGDPLITQIREEIVRLLTEMVDFIEDGQPLDMDEITPQNYVEQIYEIFKDLENLKEKINYYVRQDCSDDSEDPNPKSNKGKKKYISFGWKYYARNGKVRKRTFVYRKKTLDYSDHIKKIELNRWLIRDVGEGWI